MNTPKIILLFVAAFLAFSASAQKIKVKKGEILLDKNPVAKLVKSEAEDAAYKYSLTSMADEVAVEFNYRNELVTLEGKQSFYRWLSIKQPNGELVNEVDFKFLSFTMNTQKGIAEFLIKKLQFLNKEGINTSKVKEFFSEKRVSESKAKFEEKQKELDAAAAANEAFAVEGKARIQRIRPHVKNDLTTVVTGGAMGTEVIATVSAPDKYPDTKTNPIKVYDLDNNLIATAITDFGVPVRVSLIDGSTFEYSNRFQLKGGLFNHNFLTELVEQVVGRGFELGTSYRVLSAQMEKAEMENNRIQKEEKEKEFQKRLSKANHFREKKGYVITKEGEKIEGPITIFFQKVHHPDNFANQFINGLSYSDGDGTVLTIKVKDEKGKLKNKRFRAKENVSFAVFDENGKETVFKSITMGNTIFKDWRFHQFIETHEDIDIFRSYKKNLIVKRLDKEKSYYVDYEFHLKKEQYDKKDKIKLAKMINYFCDKSDVPSEDGKLKIEGLSIFDSLDLLKNQFSEDDVESVKEIIDATKDCVIKE